jgi:hypothetical protein
LRASEIYGYPLQTSAFGSDPLAERRRVVREEFAAGPPPEVRLDTTLFVSSPLLDYRAELRAAMTRGEFALPAAPSVKAIATPAYSRASYLMHEGEGLRVRVELGPLIWHQTERGSRVGGWIDTFA